jgi:hypothetical protein
LGAPFGQGALLAVFGEHAKRSLLAKAFASESRLAMRARIDSLQKLKEIMEHELGE